MGIEIERKFLTVNDTWREGVEGTPYRQGYLSRDPARVVRVRTMGERAALTIKTQRTSITRGEWEWGIPVDEADEILDQVCLPPLIDKKRYRVPVGEHTWEVDEFFGANGGLVVAEIELGAEDEVFERPGWLGEEVTEDARYLNANLAKVPFGSW